MGRWDLASRGARRLKAAGIRPSSIGGGGSCRNPSRGRTGLKDGEGRRAMAHNTVGADEGRRRRWCVILLVIRAVKDSDLAPPLRLGTAGRGGEEGGARDSGERPLPAASEGG
jgi:hypothetical protein